MFSTEHFIWIGLCAAFVAGMLIFCIRKKVSLKVAGYVMSGICLCSESSKIHHSRRTHPRSHRKIRQRTRGSRHRNGSGQPEAAAGLYEAVRRGGYCTSKNFQEKFLPTRRHPVSCVYPGGRQIWFHFLWDRSAFC